MADLLAPNPSKRRAELFVLLYSPAWMAAIAGVMFSGLLSRWGDAEHLALGLALVAPVWAGTALFSARHDRGRPAGERHAVRFNLWIAALSLVQTYAGSVLFFDRLGMEYHFRTAWVVNRTPAFLYLLTMVYFSTYYVVMQVGLRAFRARAPGAPPAAVWLVRALLAYGFAFGETFSMANETLRPFFSYRDRSFTLWYGSLAYGSLFLCTLPLLERLDEARQPTGTVRELLRDLAAANLLALGLYEVFGALIAWQRG